MERLQLLKDVLSVPTCTYKEDKMVEFLEDNFKYPVEKVRYLVKRLFEKGILMSIDGPNNNVLKIKPPLVFNLENADFLLANFYKVMKEDFMGE
jgi:4-aminobutyrate aminotransferase-like enzyme